MIPRRSIISDPAVSGPGHAYSGVTVTIAEMATEHQRLPGAELKPAPGRVAQR